MPLSIRNSIFKTAVSCTASLLLFTGAASAKTQTESFTTYAPLGGSAHDGNNFILPDFDTTLGTLESVDVTLKFSSRSSIRVFNDGCSPVGFTDASVTTPITVDGPGSLNLNTSLLASLGSGSARPGINNYWVMKSSTKDKLQVNPVDFSLWENQPDNQVSFVISKGGSTYQGTDSASDLFFGGKAKERGKIAVEYTYLTDSGCSGSGNSGNSGSLAVPEPPAKYLSAIVAAAMLLVVIRRKRLLLA